MPIGAPRAVRQGARWEDAYGRCRQVAPEAFDPDRVRNLWNGAWQAAGDPADATSPVYHRASADNLRARVRAAVDALSLC